MYGEALCYAMYSGGVVLFYYHGAAFFQIFAHISVLPDYPTDRHTDWPVMARKLYLPDFVPWPTIPAERDRTLAVLGNTSWQDTENLSPRRPVQLRAERRQSRSLPWQQYQGGGERFLWYRGSRRPL